jgi:hypothetical protein
VAAFAKTHAPVSEITDVDELNSPLGTARRKHVAASSDPTRPVREAVRWVMRSDDEAGPYARDAIREGRLKRFLTACFERSIAVVSCRAGSVLVERSAGGKR